MLLEKAQGCLVGLACGDAVGTTLEFQEKGTFEKITDMLGGCPFHLNKGEWTDDTSMALCLADSLLANNGFNARDQMERYERWMMEGYNSSRPETFDVGQTVSRAIIAFSTSKDLNPYQGSTLEWTAGNGSLMRLAPIPMFYHDNLKENLDYAELSSKTTHSAADCLSACRYFAEVIFRALNGEQDKDALFNNLQDYAWSPAMQKILSGEFKQKTENEVFGTGYVIDSLEAALWAFYQTDNFKDAILKATNLGDDADTTAAICGQIAGAFYGLSGIPEKWRACLFKYEHICEVAKGLVAKS